MKIAPDHLGLLCERGYSESFFRYGRLKGLVISMFHDIFIAKSNFEVRTGCICHIDLSFTSYGFQNLLKFIKIY